ncbi:hypothetical protein [Mycolicibacter longobardus]|nr:hypothetical protein [Mycolicibacter longobardus]MCV7385701.1 hypothetical protein [Mycolicibacter longobardus]
MDEQPEHHIPDDGAAAPSKPYSLAEVAEMILPPEWTDGERWGYLVA